MATTRINEPWGLFFCNGSTRPSFAGSSTGDTEAVYVIYFDPIDVDSTTYVFGGTPTIKQVVCFRRSDIVNIESNTVIISQSPYYPNLGYTTIMATINLFDGTKIELYWDQAYVNFLSGTSQADANYWNFLVTATSVNTIRYGSRPSASGTITTISGYLSSSAYYTRRVIASGAAFPTSPVVNDLFYNSTYKCLFVWDGTRWSAPFVNIYQSGLARSVGATVAETLLIAVKIPKELIQTDYEVVYDYIVSATVSANSKTLTWAVTDNVLGVVNRVNISNVVSTTQPFRKQRRKIAFKNSLASQLVSGIATDDSSFGSNNAATGVVLTKNFASADFYLCCFGQKAVSGETLTLEQLRVSIIGL